MLTYVLVALGGAGGALMRFSIGRVAAANSLAAPWATLGINVLGGLLMGVLAGWAAARGASAESWRLFLGAGVLGGFTTFSAYSLEIAALIEDGRPGLAAVYAAGSVALALGGVFLGLWLARRWLA